jgi:hypothetical protein
MKMTVFTLAGAFWGQLEYWSLSLIPWANMLNREAPVKDSLLLDYVSIWNVTALFKSLKQRHFLVTLAVLGTLLIKLSTISSTGLFTLSNPTIQVNKNHLLTHTFNASGFDPLSVSVKPFMISFANLRYNVNTPIGVHENHAFPKFFDGASDHGNQGKHDMVCLQLTRPQPSY